MDVDFFFYATKILGTKNKVGAKLNEVKFLKFSFTIF